LCLLLSMKAVIYLWKISFVMCLLWISYIIFCQHHLLLQSYNRDLFLFLYFLLIIVSAMTSFKIHHDKSPLSGKSILYLNRHQTEEWKGWMQVGHFFVDITEVFYSLIIYDGKTFCAISELCKFRPPEINTFNIKEVQFSLFYIFSSDFLIIHLLLYLHLML